MALGSKVMREPHTEGYVAALTRWLRSSSRQRPTYRISANLFLRLLGGVYFIAFLSLWVQVDGLIGSRGILPVGDTMARISNHMGSGGVWHFPTLFWINHSDLFLHFVCGGGILLSLAGVLLPAVWPVWLLLWAFYLSLLTVGRDFLSFQWDVLLLESGFLALLLVPPALRPVPGVPGQPPHIVSWLYRWLLFRLMFASGVVKLASGDPSWRGLTALTYHYQTQPIPNRLSWYAHQLPERVHTASAAGMFAIELAVPFFIFAPRRLRLTACVLFVGLQTLIVLTGNYTYFNLLAVALCLWLIDDATWPHRLRRVLPDASPPGPRPWPRWVLAPFAALVILLSALLFSSATFRFQVPWPAPVEALYRALAPFRIVNTYGLFSVMTTERPEIILEGSADGIAWEPYEFRYKPGDLSRPPPFVVPHQPRLDWQLWFAALGDIQRYPWFFNLCIRLLDGSQPVLDLLAHNPFPDHPPRYVRARLYTYRFTTPEEKRRYGRWWEREFKSEYLPPIRRKIDSQ